MIGTSLVHEHEIAKNHDFQHGFESIMRNTSMLDKMLVSASRNYVIGGEVTAETTGSMNVFIRPLWANGRSLEMPVYSEQASRLIYIDPPEVKDRIDVIEVRGVLEPYDNQRRAFFDPELENGRYYNVNTKVRLITEIKVIRGEEASTPVAPPIDEGYVKLAEIYLPVGETIIEDGRIRNITALVDGEDNKEWTNDLKTSFYLGSLSDIKTMFGLEHNRDGTHRAGVIKLPYLKIGLSDDALRAMVLPLGDSYIVNQDEWLADMNTLAALHMESIIRARDELIERQIRFEKDWELEQRIKALEQMMIDIMGRLLSLWDAVHSDITSNLFLYTFSDLLGITLLQGNWDSVNFRLDCSLCDHVFNYTFINLDRITLVQGVWNSFLEGSLGC
jgi:hypothetical protein